MPLEIRQIGIRMRVGDDAPTDSRDVPESRAFDGFNEEARARIVQDCTRAVLAALARNARR